MFGAELINIVRAESEIEDNFGFDLDIENLCIDALAAEKDIIEWIFEK